MRRALAAGALLLAGALACGPDRAAQLRAEIKQLKEARMERDAVAKARQEADAAEVASGERKAEVEKARAQAAEREAEVARLQSAFDAEVARNAQLRADVESEQQQIQQRAEAASRLEHQVAEATARGQWARNQADQLARELAIDDPDWAVERRLRALREFLAALAKEYPDDVVLAELALSTRPVAASATGGSDTRTQAAGVAARVRDRFTRVYGLEAKAAPPGP